MRLRWLWFDYLPPELGLNRAERRAVRRRANELGRFNFRVAIRFSALYLLFLLPIIVAWIAFTFAGLISRELHMSLAIAYVPASWLVIAYAWGKTQWPLMWEALRENGYDICRDCRYDLRGLDETVERCPECGWVREKMPSNRSTADAA